MQDSHTDSRIISTGLGNIVIPVTLIGTLGTRAGVNSDGVLIGKQTLQDPEHVFNDDGGSFTDVTTEAISGSGSTFAIMAATPATGDHLYVGHSTKQFNMIFIDINTAANAGLAGDWQYYNGSSWTNLTAEVDDAASGTDDFSAGTSEYFITWEIPSDWETTAINSQTDYWIRYNCTGATTPGTPLGEQIEIKTLEDGAGLVIPFAGTLSKIVATALTDSGANNDSKFNIINLTQGTFDTWTYTQNSIIDTDSSLSLSINEDDQIVIQMYQEDGSTEYADVVAQLLF